MKTRKNHSHNHSKTTFASLITDLDRWYGPSWKISGLIMAGIFLVAVVLPGILG